VRLVTTWRRALFLLFGSTLVLAACGPSHLEPKRKGRPVNPEPARTVEQTLESLSADQKIGQLISTFVYGGHARNVTAEQAEANRSLYGVETPAEVVATYHLGGILLLSYNPFDPDRPYLRTENYQSPEQVAGFTNGLQEAAAGSSGIGLLISADQEGGEVNRLGEGMTIFPAPRVLGALHDAATVEEAAHISGQELRAVGVNHVLAPVADVVDDPDSGVIGDRAFGSDPALVSRMVAAAIRGYSGAGIAATAKHFPGHGATNEDSHKSLARIPLNLNDWSRIHLPPFQAAIEAHVPAIMTAHISMAALDPSGRPATVSPSINTDELRENLGFEGVIVTDSLWMKGIRTSLSEDEVVVAAIDAGADLLLSPPDVAEAIQAIKGAIQSGRISEVQLEESVRRVLTLKERLGVLEPPRVDVSAVSDVVGTGEHRQAHLQIQRMCEALDDPSLGC
jgi:beta-N-acetylhexosaminidase